MTRPHVPTLCDAELRLRPFRDEPVEYERMVRWRNTPHVREWWDPDDPPLTFDGAIRECRPSAVGDDPTAMLVIEVGDRPAGFVQCYHWADYREDADACGLQFEPGSCSLDIFIGEADLLSRGIGRRTVRLLCDHLLAQPGVTEVAFGVDRDNIRARRAYEAAGMVAGFEYLDTDTRNGARTTAVMMVRRR